MWVKVQDWQELSDRRAVAIIRQQDFRRAGYIKGEFGLCIETAFSEEMVRKILEKTYGKYDVSKWQLHAVKFDVLRYAFEVMVTSPDFEPVEHGIVSPVIDSYNMIQHVAKNATEIMRRVEEEVAVDFE